MKPKEISVLILCYSQHQRGSCIAIFSAIDQRGRIRRSLFDVPDGIKSVNTNSCDIRPTGTGRRRSRLPLSPVSARVVQSRVVEHVNISITFVRV